MDKMENRATARDDNARGVTLWFTGLSGAGKSTLSERVTEILDPLMQNFTEPQQDWQLDSTERQGVDERFQVDPRFRILRGMHPDVSVLPH